MRLVNTIFRSSSVLLLLFVNLIPIFQIVFFNLNVYTLIQIYFVEYVIVCFFSLLKVLKVSNYGEGGHEAAKTPFILLLSSPILFCFVLIYSYNLGNNIFHQIGTSELSLALKSFFLISFFPFLGFFFSHLYSYLFNFLGKKEYMITSKKQLANIPYRNFLYSFAFVFTGIDLFKKLAITEILVVFLVFAKILADTYFHIKDHNLSDFS